MTCACVVLALALLQVWPGAAFAEVAAGAGVSASTCRALINMTGQLAGPGAADPEAVPEHFVVDLRVGPEIQVETGRGLVVRDGATAWALELVGHQRSDTGPAGTMDRAWNDLVATRLPDGEPAVWIDGTPELLFPEPGRHAYESHRIHAVTGVVGPYVSVEGSSPDALRGCRRRQRGPGRGPRRLWRGRVGRRARGAGGTARPAGRADGGAPGGFSSRGAPRGLLDRPRGFVPDLYAARCSPRRHPLTRGRSSEVGSALSTSLFVQMARSTLEEVRARTSPGPDVDRRRCQ